MTNLSYSMTIGSATPRRKRSQRDSLINLVTSRQESRVREIRPLGLTWRELENVTMVEL